MKKILLVIGLMFLICPKEVFAGYQELNNLKYDVTINSDGSMNVTETWDVYISETNTMFKNFEKDDSKYSGITNVKVREVLDVGRRNLIKLNEWQYHVKEGYYYGTENEEGNFEIGWGVGLDDSSASRIYEIEYKVLDVITKASDYSELYWQFVGNENSIYINNIEGNIKLPATGLNKEMIKVWGHTESLDGTIYPTDTPNGAYFNLNDVYGGTMVEIRVLFPSMIITGDVKRIVDENILDKVIAEETVWAEEANAKREKKASENLTITTIICGILGVFTLSRIKSSLKIIKKEKKLKPTLKLKYFRDLPRENATPTEAYYLEEGNLYSLGIAPDWFGEIFLATILQLNLKKYIEFEVDNTKSKKEQITIKVLEKNVDELEKEDEKLIYNFLFKMQKEEKIINSKTLEKYIQKNATKTENLFDDINIILISNLEKENLLNKKNQMIGMGKSIYFVFNIIKIMLLIVFTVIMGITCFSTRNIINTNYIIFVILALTLGLSIIEFVLDIIATNRLNILTQEGVDEKEKWKGLKNYMKDFSLLKEKEIPSIVVWEKYLVYATAFGIAKEVIKQLKIVYPEIENMTDSTLVTTNLLLSSNFNDTFTRSVNSSINSIMSSGTGSGGGFSSGGGGGRRWWRHGRPLMRMKQKEPSLLFHFKCTRGRPLKVHFGLDIFN